MAVRRGVRYRIIVLPTICRGEIETQFNNAHPPLRGCFHFGGWVDVGIDPYGMESEIPPHVGADAYIGPLKCCGFALDFRENGRFPAGGQGRPPLRRKIETQCNNALPPIRGCFHFGGWVDVGIDPYDMESEIPPHVGADAYIGPLKCCDFASDFHKTGQFRRADRVVRPYGVESKTNTVSPENRHKTGASCGSMRRPQASFEAQPRNARLLAPRWASTPTLRNAKRGDFSPDPHVLSNTLCRGGRLCPPSKFVEFSWLFVGADAYIGPLKCCDFALDFRENGHFRRADRVVHPYGAKWQTDTGSAAQTSAPPRMSMTFPSSVRRSVSQQVMSTCPERI